MRNVDPSSMRPHGGGSGGYVKRSLVIVAAVILGFVMFLLSAAANAGDLVGRQGDDWVRLTEAPCTNKAVIERLPADQAGSFNAATASFQGQQFVACWRMVGNGAYLVYEDGDQGLVPSYELKPALDV